MLVRAARRAVMGTLFPFLFLAACGHTAPSVTMSTCGSDPQTMPTVIDVVCNTDDITAINLVWTAWGQQAATAHGTATIDECAYEDCHTGAFNSVPIKLIASKIIDCAAGGREYSTLRYVFADGNPWPGVPANLNTGNYIAGPDRTLPPANQTVSLTCS